MENNGWLSVHECLPPDAYPVLVAIRYEPSYFLVPTIGQYQKEFPAGERWACSMTMQFFGDEVEYWQPLPKVPMTNHKESE